jgi:hypothetical protein
MASNDILLDAGTGNFTTGQYSGRRSIRWPFLVNGDRVTVIYERTVTFHEETFAPAQLGVERDPEDSAAYCVGESDPRWLGVSDLVQVTRTYARIPPTQTVEDESIMISRPSPGLASYPGALGDYRIFKPDSTLNRFDAYLAKTVTSDTGVPGFYPSGGTYSLSFDGDTTAAQAYNVSSATLQTELNGLTAFSDRGGCTVSGSYNSSGGFVVTFASYAAATFGLGSLLCTAGTATATVTLLNSGYTQRVRIQSDAATPFDGKVSSGTYTVTIGADTTGAIDYNANITTIQTALNALASVTARGGCTVTGSGWSGADAWIDFTINFSNATITADASALTVAPCTINVTADSVGRVQTIKFTGGAALRTIYSAGHGIASTDTIYIKGGSTYYSAIAGTFTVPDANNITLTVAASASYANASTITEVGKRTKQNYTAGSAPTLCDLVTRFSLEPLTPDTYQGDDVGFLLGILSGSTAINYRVGDSARWPTEQSPIRSITTTRVSSTNL